MKGGPICEAIAWNMQIARREKGMTTRELVKASCIPTASIELWTRQGFSGTVDHLYKLHKALGIPLWDLVPTAEEVEDLEEQDE